jgi:hypothetical protein
LTFRCETHQALLNNLHDAISNLAKSNPREADVVFKSSLIWKTDLAASAFSDPSFTTEG